MKKILFLILFLGFFFSVLSQEKEGKRKISISPTAYFVSTVYTNGDYNDNSFESLSSNSTGEYTLDINIPFKKRLEIKTGIGFNMKYSDAFLTNIENVRVNEYFVRIPLLLTYIVSNNNIKVYMSLGPYADILASQKFYFKDETTIPVNFNDSYSFGSYTKLGLALKVGFRFPISENLFFDFGLNTSSDYKNLFINPNNNPSYDYSTYGIYLSFGMF